MLSSFGALVLACTSVILWVNPLVLISLLQVLGDIVCCPNEGLVGGVISGIIVQVCLGNGEGLELLNGEVVMSNLREGERLFVDITSVNLDCQVLKSCLLSFFPNLHSSFEMLLVKGNTELIKLHGHSIAHLIDLLHFLSFLGSFILFLNKLQGFGLLLLVVNKFLFLSLFLVFLLFLLLFELHFLVCGLLLNSFLFLESFSLCSFLLSFDGGLLLSLQGSLSLLSFEELLLLIFICSFFEES